MGSRRILTTLYSILHLADIGGEFSNGFESIFESIGILRRRHFSVRNAINIRKLQTNRRRYYMTKRTHTLDNEAKQCLATCNECTPFLRDHSTLIKAGKLSISI